MNKLRLTVALSVVVLAACSPGVSVDTKSEASLGNKQSSDVSRDASVGNSEKSGRDIKMPVVGYVNDVLNSIELVRINSKSGGKSADPAFQGLLNSWAGNPLAFDLAKFDRAAYPPGQASVNAYPDWSAELIAAKDKADEGDEVAQLQIKHLALIRIVGKSAAENVMGWPEEGRLGYAKRKAYFLHFGNKLLTELASKTPEKALADPSQARAKVIEDLLAITPVQMRLMHEQSAQEVKDEFAIDSTPDDSTGRGASWSTAAGANYYSGQSDGWTWTKNGVPWFGHGKLSGQEVSISLASSFDSSQQTKRSLGTGSDTSSAKKNSSSASVK